MRRRIMCYIRKITIGLITILLVSWLNSEIKTVAQLEDWYKEPSIFNMDKIYLYVVDKNRGQIVKYSRKDYKPVLQFGRSGEGPGEFRSIQSIQVIDQEIVISNVDRISIFSLNGLFQKDIRKPHGYTYKTAKIQNSFLFKRYSGKLNSYLLWDENFKKVKEIYSIPDKVRPRDRATGKRIVNLLPLLDFYRTGKNHIVIGDTQQGFFFKIFNADGRYLNEIKLKVTPRRITEEDRKRIMIELTRGEKRSKWWQQAKKRFKYIFPDYYPAYSDFFVRDEKLYVFGYESADAKQQVTVLNMKGNVLKQRAIPYIGEEHFRFHDYQIYEELLFYIFDNLETECWELRGINLQ